MGVADNCTDELAHIVISATSVPMTRKSIWATPIHELKTDAVLAKMLELNAAIECRFGDKTLKHAAQDKDSELEEVPGINDLPPDDLWGDDEPIAFAEPNDELKDAEAFAPDELGNCLNAELLLPHGDKMQRARVVRHQKDDNDNLVGPPHENPVLDTRMCEVQFPVKPLMWLMPI